MAGDLGTIPAGGSTALTVSSDNVLVRDMIINAGAGSNAKGIVVSRSATKLALRRVSVTLGTGLGIQADTSATLAMDQCYVQDNSAGGLLINSAGFTVQNTVFASNGYGVQFSTTASPQVFSFNTVVESVAAVCNLTSPQTLSDSIVVGSALNCSLANSLTTAPSFSSSSPYHLTTHVPCKSTPASTAMVPDHDIDGDMRPSSGTDCGADQYVGP